MGPLQYLVVGYDREHFRDYVLPELNSLTRRRVIRVIDVVVVSRGAGGEVESRELSEALPEHDGVISRTRDNIVESFTRDDISVVGKALPPERSVALVLFEHCWADRLEEEVFKANQYIDDSKSSIAGEIALSLEHRLARGTLPVHDFA